jgi:hypothetical protein
VIFLEFLLFTSAPRVSIRAEDFVAHHLKCPSTQRTVDLTSSASDGIQVWAVGEMRGLRKRYRVLIFAALAAALIVPVGYALSIDTRSNTARTEYTAVIPAAANTVAAPVLLTHDDGAPFSVMHQVSDSAKLLCIGTILFGLAAAVRRVI